jgi:hypothetical protein
VDHDKADFILTEARNLAEHVTTWADFSKELFNQHDGLVARTFPDAAERRAFHDSEQYKEVNQILLGLMRRFGVVEGATPRKGRG